jgi:predicted HicB family RNase H-like nuclease
MVRFANLTLDNLYNLTVDKTAWLCDNKYQKRGVNVAQKNTDYKRQFNEQQYDRLYPYAKKGRKAIYEAAAKAESKSLNDFVNCALEEKLERQAQSKGVSLDKYIDTLISANMKV